MRLNFDADFCKLALRKAVLAVAVTTSLGSGLLATTSSAEAHARRGHHHHHYRHYGYGPRSGFHSCIHRSYGTRAIHFRRAC